MAPIGIISDFGNRDPYIAPIKGKILSINPEAKIVDISNEIPKYCIKNGSFVLSEAAKTFPKESTFIAMIKTESTNEENWISLQTETDLRFIGPNNGIFTLIKQEFNIREKRLISNENLEKAKNSTNFPERDIIAPVAARLNQGMNPSELGPKIENIESLDIVRPKIKDGKIEGEILHIDHFGNLISNIPENLVKEIGTFGSPLEISITGSKLSVPFLKSFGKSQKNDKLCYIGNFQTLEIAKNQGNLAREINTEITDEHKIEVRKNNR